jgi:hypothetical protein
MKFGIQFEDGMTDEMKATINKKIEAYIDKLENKGCIRKMIGKAYKNGTFSLKADCLEAQIEINKLRSEGANKI